MVNVLKLVKFNNMNKFPEITKINSNFFLDPFTDSLYCRGFIIRPIFHLFAIRHQSTIVNEKFPQRFWQGVSDEDINKLSEQSKLQAIESAKDYYGFLLRNHFSNQKNLLVKFLADGYLHIISSPLSRAYDTAVAFSKVIEYETGINISVSIDSGTYEQHGGICENKHYDEVSPLEREIWDRIRASNATAKFEEGESFLDLVGRAYSVLDSFNKKISRSNIVFLFCHKIFMSALKTVSADGSILESDGKVKFFTKSPYGALMKIPMHNPSITKDYAKVFFNKSQHLKNAKLIINGGYPLRGVVKSPGSKHTFAGILAAGLLTKRKVILRNVPPILDNYVYAALLKDIGAEVWYDDQLEIMEFKLASITNNHPSDALVKSVRNSIRFLAPMVGRNDYVKITYPGGDRIGKRSIEQYLWVLSELGVQVEEKGDYIIAQAPCKSEVIKEIVLKDPRVTPTVMAMVYAASIGGDIKISNIPVEQEVQDVATFIEQMGVPIELKFEEKSSLSYVKIQGRISCDYKNPHLPLEYTIPPDRMFPVTFGVLAGLTNSEITVVDYREKDYDGELEALKKMGVNISTCTKNNVNALKFKVGFPSQIDYPLVSDFGDISGMEKTQRINTDLLPFFAVLATKLFGQQLTFKDYTKDNRTHDLGELSKMGASINIVEGSNLFYITGVPRLKGQVDLTGNDLRAAMTLIIAALSVDDASKVSGIDHAYRGYSHLCEKLKILGANVANFPSI